MTPGQKRRAQLVLAGVLALVAGAVSLSLRTPVDAPAPPAAESLAPGQANTSRTADLVYRIFREGRESLTVKARRMEGSEKEELLFTGVELSFTYMAQGQPGTGSITADEARHAPAQQRAQFRGHVVLKTSDGFELATEALNYRADRGIARSDRPVSFKRKDLSGRATGMIYHAETGTVELQSQVAVRIDDPDQPPVEIRSGRALFEKDKGTLEFLEGVTSVQGGDRLEARSYFLEFVRQTRAWKRAFAYGDAVLTLRGGGVAGASAPGAMRASGTRVLRAPKIDLWFRPDRSLEELAAGPGAELRLVPGAKAQEGARTLRARVLVFRLDGQGRLAEVQGQKDSSFLSEPPRGSQAPPLEAACRAFVAHVEPETGELREIDFMRDVEFRRGTQRASAMRARLQADGLLRLVRKPELHDSARRMRLGAPTIELQTRTGDLHALGGVRQVIEPQAGAEGAPGGLLSQGAGATLIVAQEVFHDQAKRVTRYSGEALLRAGGDEVRAPRLQIAERADGLRTFTAEDGVVSRFAPQPPTNTNGAAPRRAALEARARLMVFDEGLRRIAYRQEVVLRQERLVTKSPRADLTLGPDGRSLQSLVAGEPVELLDGDRKVWGQRATYTPADEKVVVEGDEVRLTGPGQEAHGRTLTFRVGDDTILVDGREESRTETVFRKEPPKP